ncbi:PD-(D/E)XK nuclease family protein [soil metagenome]
MPDDTRGREHGQTTGPDRRASTLIDRCLEILEGGGTVVTANKRLARRLRQDYAAARSGSWATPDALPWFAWLSRLWDAAAWADDSPVPALLGEALELELWEAAVSADRGRELLDRRAAAREARQAHLRLAAWLVDESELLRHDSEECRAFVRWRSRFQDRCGRDQWIDAARLPDAVSSRLPAIADHLPERLALAGFDEITPQQAALLDALSYRGIAADIIPFDEAVSSVRRIEAADRSDELETAARWARRLILAEPRRRIGIVLPDLATVREDVRRIFTEVLAPNSEPTAEDRLPFHLSAGRRLIDYPLVHAACLLLELVDRPLGFDAFGQLLRGPFLAGAETEAEGRALLDARLRAGGRRFLSADAVARAAAEQDAPHACPLLRGALQRLAALTSRLGGIRLPGDWLPVFDEALRALGWPGERTLSSHEFQTVEAFRSLQQEVYTLGAATGRVTYAAALALLRLRAGETMFQPEGTVVPVEIVGALEAAGLTFDHLWVGGLHDEVWPPPARPNGFLPARLQRRHGLPHASAQRELDYAARLTARLLAAAGHVVVSSPRWEFDRELRPSPLIASIPLAEHPALDDAPLAAERGYRARAFERLLDDSAPATQPSEQIRGGARVLAHQSACPFRAFAEHRLHAAVLESPTTGIDARTRGAFLHRALELLWRGLDGSDALRALAPAARQAAVARAVDVAADRELHGESAGLVSIETARARRLIDELLDIELRRPPFRVEPPERSRVVPIGGIALRVRIDRIDDVEGMGRLIIDYKTGQAQTTGWWGDRPDDPQIPLYTIADGNRISGVAVALLNSDGAGFDGIARVAGLAPGVVGFDEHKLVEESDWDAVLARWRTTLERLAGQFAAGAAEVDPKQPFETCRSCHLAALCRVDERREADAAE